MFLTISTELSTLAAISDGAWGAIGALIAGVFTLIVLIFQGNFATQRLRSVLATSETIRESVRYPVEGRWNYEMEFDEYQGEHSDKQNLNNFFRSDGIADFAWQGSGYSILLAYEILNGYDETITVGVCEGSFSEESSAGLPNSGDKIVFHYSHRLGINRNNDNSITIRRTPERKFSFELTSVHSNAKGTITSMEASFAAGSSEGKVRFTRKLQ